MAKSSYTVHFRPPRAHGFTVTVGENPVVVGRSGGEGQIELDDRRVSSSHGRLWADDQGLWYEDLGSTNGSWLAGKSLTQAVLLQPDSEIVLGETRLRLFTPPPSGAMALGSQPLTPPPSPTPQPLSPDLPAGLKVRLVGRVGGSGLTQALEGGAVPYLSAIYSLTERLLDTHHPDFLAQVLQDAAQAVPFVSHMAVVAWPPRPDGGLEALAGDASTVSTSLARHAVEQSKAMLFSSGELPPTLANAPSLKMSGMRSAIYVPLLTGQEHPGQALGLLCVDSPLPMRELDFQFLCAVAGLVAGRLAAEKIRRQESRRQALISFLQIASHDLKNPLTAIENCGRLLRRLPQERQGPVLEILEGASARATDLIRTYLDAAAVEGGKPLEVSWEALDIRRLVDQEMDFLKIALRDRIQGIELINEIPEIPLKGDARKLRQVFSNLLSNAIKYSPGGGQIRVTANLYGSMWRFCVEDQGVGIAPENLPRLFAEFSRVGDRSLAPGTGLGLWLTAALVQAHGGEIGVESEPGEGSRFWFTLPALTDN